MIFPGGTIPPGFDLQSGFGVSLLKNCSLCCILIGSCYLAQYESQEQNMKHTRTINIIIAMLLCISVVFACFGCSGKTEPMGKDTPDTHALKDYPEVVEFNKYSVIPELLGTPKELIGSGYVLKSGIEHHYETYLSSDHLDVNYNVGSLDMRYEIDPADMLYIVGVRVRTQDKTIETVNGKRVVTYISDKLVLGMKVGINYKEACRNLESFGYKKLYEQPIITSGVATSREISYGKGIIVISMAVETGGDVSSFNAWIPYDTSKIESIFDNSKVPAKLGLIYNCYGSSETTFTFLKKTQENSVRVYTSDDGSTAVMHGYPDAYDMLMCTQVTFNSSRYNVDGAKVGMTFKNCIDKLTSAGWTLLKDGSTLTKDSVTLKLFDVETLEFSDNPTVMGEDDKVVTYIRYYLPSPSHFDRVNASSNTANDDSSTAGGKQ